MKIARLMLILSLLTAGFANEADARPKYRYDAFTETCRTLYTGPLEYESRSYGRGGKMFQQVCKSCHTRDNDKGAPFLWTESYSSNGWNRVFAERYPPCAKDGSWKGVALEDIQMINDYLYRFGYGSQDITDSC